MRKTHERRKEGGNLEEGEQSLAEALRVGMTYTLSTIAARSCFKSRFFLTTTTPSIFLRLTLLLVALLSPQQTEVKRGNLEKNPRFVFHRSQTEGLKEPDLMLHHKIHTRNKHTTCCSRSEWQTIATCLTSQKQPCLCACYRCLLFVWALNGTFRQLGLQTFSAREWKINCSIR